MEKLGSIALLISNGLEIILRNIASFITLVMIIDVLVNIVARYVFNSPIFWAEELGRYSLIFSTFLVFGIALKHAEHIAITILVERLPVRLAIFADIITRILIGLFLILMTIKGVEFCILGSIQTSPALRINMGWVYSIIPISCFLQLVFLVLLTIEDLCTGNHNRHLALRNPDKYI